MSADLWILLGISVVALISIWRERRQERIDWLVKHRRRDYA